MGGGKGLGMFAGTYGSRVTGLLSGGTLVAAAAQLGTATDAGGGMGGSGNKEITLPQALASIPKNVWPSAVSFGRDLREAVMTPGETFNGLANIVAGYVCQATGIQSESRMYSDAVTVYFSNRYGSMANIKQTLASDPVGFAADMSLFLTGGSGAFRSAASAASIASRVAPAGEVARGASKAARTLSRVGEGLGKTGNLADPLTGLGAGISVISPHVLNKMPPLMRNTLKKGGTGAARSKTALGLGGTERAVERDQKP